MKEELRVVDPWSLQGRADAVVQLRQCSARACCRSASTRRPKAIARPGPACASTRDVSARPISSGVKFGFMADIPGRLGRGNWTVALFVDDKASAHAAKALTWIMTGRAGGSTALLKILAGCFLGVRQVPIIYELAGRDPHRQDREDRRRRDHAGARQGQGQRRDPQQRVLDRARHHRVARRQVAFPRCSAATGISRAVRRKSASSTGAIRRNSSRHVAAESVAIRSQISTSSNFAQPCVIARGL